LDRAVAGTPDLDRFTVFTCQTGTVRALREAAPDLKYTPHGPDRLTYSWTRKHCPEIMALLDTSRAAAK
jgi:hypothetical protein